jgi:hypothetical protein
MKIVEDRVEMFTSHGYENIAAKTNKFLKENTAKIEKVMDIKLSTSSIFSSRDTDNQIIVTVLIHYQIIQELNNQV